MGIKSKLIITFSSILVISLFFFGAVNFFGTKAVLMDITLKNLSIIADAREAGILAWIESKKSRALDFTSDGFIVEEVQKINQIADAEEKKIEGIRLSQYLKQNKQPMDQEISDILIVDSQGNIIAATRDNDLGTKGLRSFVEKSLSGVARIFDDELAASQPAVNVVAPITGHKLGNQDNVVLLLRYNLNNLYKIMNGENTLHSGAQGTIKLSNGMGAYLVNEKGLLIFAYHKMEDMGFFKKHVETEAVQKWSKSYEEINKVSLDYSGHSVLVASMSMQIDSEVHWLLVVEQETAEAFAPIYRIAIVKIIIGAIVLCFTLLIILVVAKSIVQPIEALTKAAEKISKGETDIKLDVQSKDEIGKLAKSFERMIVAIKIFKDNE